MNDLRYKGPDGAYYASARDAEMAFAWERWEKYGRYQFCIHINGDRQLFVLCERIAVGSDGSLQVFTKRDGEPEFFAGAYAPGEWRRFWILSAMDGTPSHIIDDTAWWTKKPAQQRPSNKEREKMTPRLRLKILARDNYTCKACGRNPKDGVALHVDHVVAIATGGRTEESNLQTLCADCNIGKGTTELAVP